MRPSRSCPCRSWCGPLGAAAGRSTRQALAARSPALASGATAAAVFAIHCTEDSPLFYAVWYALAILIVTGLGAALGRRVLRW